MKSETEILGWCFGCGREVEWEGEPDMHTAFGDFSEDDEVCTGPVWPGVRVHDQAEADRRIPELLAIEAPGHWVEWVPGRYVNLRCLSNRTYLGEGQDYLDALAGLVWSAGEPGYLDTCAIRNRVRWLRVVVDSTVDVADIRYLIKQARETKVRVWLERLSGLIASCVEYDECGQALGVSEWKIPVPPDLQGCRELPEVGL